MCVFERWHAAVGGGMPPGRSIVVKRKRKKKGGEERKWGVSTVVFIIIVVTNTSLGEREGRVHCQTKPNRVESSRAGAHDLLTFIILARAGEGVGCVPMTLMSTPAGGCEGVPLGPGARLLAGVGVVAVVVVGREKLGGTVSV